MGVGDWLRARLQSWELRWATDVDGNANVDVEVCLCLRLIIMIMGRLS